MQLTDNFGNKYEADILPRGDIEQILEKMDFRTVVQTALEIHNPGYTATTVYLDCVEGDLIARNHNQGVPVRNAHYIPLYSVQQYDVAGVYNACQDKEAEIIELLREEEPQLARDFLQAIQGGMDCKEACLQMQVDFDQIQEDIYLRMETSYRTKLLDTLTWRHIQRLLDDLYNNN